MPEIITVVDTVANDRHATILIRWFNSQYDPIRH